MTEHSLTTWLQFAHSPWAYKISITALLEHYGSPERFIKDKIKPADGQWTPLSQRALEATSQWAQAPEQHIITFNDPAYPPLLKEIAYPAPLLYVKGKLTTLLHPQCAIVGSRSPSYSGRIITQQFATQLASAGLCITSGLALGIDTSSHHAALAAGGKTLAVLGNGLASIYPKRNRSLAEEISQQGCLVSEFPLDAAPRKQHFPQRNRIISGLSLGTLVVEAKHRSGSLITAHHAANQGREVFAIPGSVRHALSYGCHQLIREGALLTETPADILETLGISPISLASAPNISKCNNSLPGLDPQQRQLLACVDYEETPIDTVINRSGVSPTIAARLLLNLELHGYIISATKGYQKVK